MKNLTLKGIDLAHMLLHTIRNFVTKKTPIVRRYPTDVRTIFKLDHKFFVRETHNDGSIELWAHSKNRINPNDIWLGTMMGKEIERNNEIYAMDWKMRHGADRLFKYAVSGKLPRNEVY